MPVSVIPSAEHCSKGRIRKSTVARKRRRNQNVEIDELAALVPLATPLAPPDTSLVPSSGKAPAIDKISVLRLTSTFLKLQNFMKEASSVSGSEQNVSTDNLVGRLEEAIDGFLIVLDGQADILYVSETIAGYVGLNQQDVIGQNLADITHADSATTIADSLKPTATPSAITMETRGISSQFRQFYVKFKSPSKSHAQTVVRISGNLKVKPPPSSKTGSSDERVEFIEPVMAGFVGECHIIESIPSILQVSVSYSTFSMLKNCDHRIIFIEASFKDILGHDPKEFISNQDSFRDFLHPGDSEYQDEAFKDAFHQDGFVTPFFRMLTISGDWAWMQMETVVHYKKGTLTPYVYEYKARVMSQAGGKTRCIEFPEPVLTSTTSPSNSVTQHSQTKKHSTHPLSSIASTSLSSLSSPSSNTASEPSPIGSVQSSLGSDAASLTPPSIIPVSPHSHTNPSPCTLSSSHLSSSSSVATSNICETNLQESLVPSPIPVAQLQEGQPVLNTPVEGISAYCNSGDVQSCSNLESCLETQTSPWPLAGSVSMSTSSASPSNVPWTQQDYMRDNGSFSSATCSGTPSPFYGSDVSNGSTFAMPFHNVAECDFQSGVGTSTTQSATSIPFESSNYIPEASLGGFDHQIPSDFNFFGDTSNPSVDFSLLDDPIFDSSNPPPHSEYTTSAGNDSVLQQLLGEILALNGNSDSNGIPSHAHSNTHRYQSRSNSSLPFQGFQSVGLRSSSSEVQDGLQQFM